MTQQQGTAKPQSSGYYNQEDYNSALAHYQEDQQRQQQSQQGAQGPQQPQPQGLIGGLFGGLGGGRFPIRDALASYIKSRATPQSLLKNRKRNEETSP